MLLEKNQRIKMFKNKNYIPAFWFSSNNFGDSLTHYLIKKLSKKTPILCSQDESCDKIMVTGSLLHVHVRNAIVWGCGTIDSRLLLPSKKEFRAVRGPLTAHQLKRSGYDCPEIYGDPALFLPYLYQPIISEWCNKYDLGIIPHYTDLKFIADQDEISSSVLIIDINDPIEKVITQINSCKKIISSSLHGIITSHAYKIPCEWVKFSDELTGDDIKFKDYYESIGVSNKIFLDLRQKEDLLEFLKDWYRLSKQINENLIPFELPDLKKMLDVCPFYENSNIQL